MAKTTALAEAPINGIDRLKAGPERLGEFLKDVRSEMRKVITPSREEVQSTTLVVLACVFFFAAYFAIVDFLVTHSVDALFRHLSSH